MIDIESYFRRDDLNGVIGKSFIDYKRCSRARRIVNRHFFRKKKIHYSPNNKKSLRVFVRIIQYHGEIRRNCQHNGRNTRILEGSKVIM